jgi:hypothetical protein
MSEITSRNSGGIALKADFLNDIVRLGIDREES